jgi:hypothetical protein
MKQAWLKRPYGEIATLYESAVQIVAEWHDGSGGEVTLYADGVVESNGAVPIELLAYVLVEWHAHLRAVAAPGQAA